MIEGLSTTSHKKFSEGKQVHVGMEASKTNQTIHTESQCAQARLVVRPNPTSLITYYDHDRRIKYYKSQKVF